MHLTGMLRRVKYINLASLSLMQAMGYGTAPLMHDVSTFLTTFVCYEVGSGHRRVLRYNYRNILGLLFKLMALMYTMVSRALTIARQTPDAVYDMAWHGMAEVPTPPFLFYFILFSLPCS